MQDQTNLNFVDPDRVRENLKAHLAKTAKIVQGKQLALNDGRLVLGFGDNRQIIPDGEMLKLTIGVDFARVGFVSWQGIKPAYRVSALYEGPPPQLEDMPDRDPALWPLSKAGKPYDPWSSVVLLLALDTIGDFYTVTLSDWRSREEFQTLAAAYLDHNSDQEFPEVHLTKSTAVLSPTRQVEYIEMKIIGWEEKKAFADMMKAAGIKIASVAQAVTPKSLKTEPASSPPDLQEDDRWWDRQ
jgi:hypothetical protein